MHWFIPFVGLVLFEVIADIFAKEWSLPKTNPWWCFVFAVTAYLIANMFWLFAIKYGSGLAKGATLFSVATALVASCIGIFYYKEQLNHIQIAGIVIGVISLTMIAHE